MISDSETRKVVENYFQAWTSKRADEAFQLLAPDLHFAGPQASYSTAEEFRVPLQKFAAMTRSARVVELIVSGDRAALLYDCELPAPIGTIRIGSFFRVRDGKISWYETQFDATELRKLQAAAAAK